MAEAFVYSWKNTTTNQIYIGWHKGSDTDGYICSSKVMLAEYNENPELFQRFIIAHGSAADMLALEQAILTSMDAKNDPTVYNQTNGNKNFILKSITEEHRLKISRANKGRKHSEESKEKMRIARANRPSPGMSGKRHTTETRDKMKAAQTKNSQLLSEKAKEQWKSQKLKFLNTAS